MHFSLLVAAMVATASANMTMGDMQSHDSAHNHDNHDSQDSIDSASKTSVDSSATLVPVPHSGGHHHGMPILDMHLTPEERLYWENYSTETYFTTPSNHRSALYLHIASYVASYSLVYPIVLIFANIKHVLYLPALTVHTVLVLVSAINFWVFSASIKDLYPGNAFSTMTVLLFFGSIAHWVVALLASTYRYLNIDNEFDYAELDDDEGSSMDSPQLTLRASSTQSFELEDLSDSESHMKTSNDSMLKPKTSALSRFFLKFPAVKKVTQIFGKTALSINAVINWASFAYFLVYFPTGLATYFVYGTGRNVFNLLAHFIKGGVFFVLGLVTLARYCGAFQNKGWAWNHRFVSSSLAARSGWLKWQSEGLWTMESVEAGLILFYGSTNIFMEHMSNSGGEWSAKDLQHMSIAFIYIGCGLCGVLLERKLASWRFQRATAALATEAAPQHVSSIVKATPGFSPNPFPVLTIYWTGVLMSSHEQASELSTAIHKQWGNLFVMACAFRVVTYIYCMLSSVNYSLLKKPSYPMTELIVAFSLLCGGLIFMESCDPVVQSFEYHGLTAMFTLNINLGIVALLMAWVMALFSIKDSLISRMRSK